MSREDQYSVTVTVDGIDYGVWDGMTGGEIDSEEAKYKPGGLSPQVALGGTREVSNITASRLYQFDRDHSRINQLIARVGKGKATVARQPLDVDGNTFGKPTVYTGILKQVTPPDFDSESGDVGKIEIEISTNAVVA